MHEDPRSRSRWISLLGRLAWLLLCLSPLVVYGCTLAPDLTWQHDGADGGDLIAAAVTLGVPHPSGYPTYVLLARVFLHVLPWGGPAARVHWLSALSGTVAVVFLAVSLCQGRRGSEREARSHTSRGMMDSRRDADQLRTWLRPLAAASAALAFAFSPLLWSQATIAEVHALHVAFVAALWVGLLRWRARPSLRLATGLAFIYGLSLGNHLSILFLSPILLGWMLFYRRRWSVPRWGWLALMAGLACGLVVYGYLPWAASRQPPVNWGDPTTVDRFWWLVSGRVYREAVFGLPWSDVPGRLSAWAYLLLRQFGWWGWLLALVGVWDMSRRDRPALTATLFAFVAFSVYAVGYDRPDSYLYLLPSSLMVAFWLGRGLLASLEMAQQSVTPRPRVALLAVGVLLLALPLVPLTTNFDSQDLSGDQEAATYAADVLESVGPQALILTSADRETFALWYGRYALRERPDVTILNGNLWAYDWYRRTVEAHELRVASEGLADAALDLHGLVGAVVRERPVYVTESGRSMVGEAELRSAGSIYQVLDMSHRVDGP